MGFPVWQLKKCLAGKVCISTLVHRVCNKAGKSAWGGPHVLGARK